MNRRLSPQQIQAYYLSGGHGCFVDRGGMPDWARKAARRADDKFRSECRNGYQAEAVISLAAQGTGKGKRAVNFQHVMMLDPIAFTGFQDFGNCTAQMYAEDVGEVYGVDIVVKGEPHEYVAWPGTAVTYGHRGTSSQGMALSTGANVVHNIGIQLRIEYLDGKYDFREEDTDETYGNGWGRTGVPRDLLDAVSGNVMEQVSRIQEEEACLDVLYNGGAIGHGSTLTARPVGALVSPLQAIGGHAQAWIGYDDTDEFRDWYRETTGNRINDWVGINDQSWGRWNDFDESLWPTHLWGPRPEGAWVVTGRNQMNIINNWGDAYALSNLIGFPAREIPPWQEAFDWL